MKYALNLADDGRIESVTYEEYAAEGSVLVDELPNGDVRMYCYVGDKYIYNPIPAYEQPAETPSQLDIIEAQVTYTAMMTDTLLEEI